MAKALLGYVGGPTTDQLRETARLRQRITDLESEVLRLAPAETSGYLQALIDAWRACAYARRPPALDAVQALAQGYGVL